MLNSYSINSSASYAPLNSKPNFETKELQSATQDYTPLKYVASTAAILLISTVAYCNLSSLFLFSRSTPSSNNNFVSSSSTNMPASLSYNPIASRATSFNLTNILPFKIPVANFELIKTDSISLNFSCIAQILSLARNVLPSLPHYFFQRSTLFSFKAIANTTLQHRFNLSKNKNKQNLSLQKCKQEFDDTPYIDPDEFNDIQEHQIKNSILENEVLVSGGIGTLAATITYFAAEHFYPALDEISEEVIETIQTCSSQQNGFEEIWDPILPNAQIYKSFLELLSNIKNADYKIGLVDNLNKLIHMIDHILTSDHVKHTSLTIHTQNALRKTRFDYQQTIQIATQKGQIETRRSLASTTCDLLANALNQIISKTNPMTFEANAGHALDALNMLVRNMFKISQKVTQISKKVITQHSRASFSQQFAALTFTACALASYLWLRKTN